MCGSAGCTGRAVCTLVSSSMPARLCQLWAGGFLSLRLATPVAALTPHCSTVKSQTLSIPLGFFQSALLLPPVPFPPNFTTETEGSTHPLFFFPPTPTPHQWRLPWSVLLLRAGSQERFLTGRLAVRSLPACNELLFLLGLLAGAGAGCGPSLAHCLALQATGRKGADTLFSTAKFK